MNEKRDISFELDKYEVLGNHYFQETAAMREIVEAVAVQGVFWEDGYCPWCDEPVWMAPEKVKHAPDCPITKARALLGSADGE